MRTSCMLQVGPPSGCCPIRFECTTSMAHSDDAFQGSRPRREKTCWSAIFALLEARPNCLRLPESGESRFAAQGSQGRLPGSVRCSAVFLRYFSDFSETTSSLGRAAPNLYHISLHCNEFRYMARKPQGISLPLPSQRVDLAESCSDKPIQRMANQ